VPLILAAASESARAKHRRLSDQLAWADEIGCLDAAIQHLEGLPADRWEFCGFTAWDKTGY
jgi:hypothetical protein